MKRKFMMLLFAIAIINPFTIVTTMALQNDEEVTSNTNNSNNTVEENVVIPKESDFTFSGTTLTGISSTFINGLSDIEKQNIHLVIPAKTTSIGSKAFSKSEGINQQCNYISLDLSIANALVEIKDRAFSGCNKISGSLIIPDSVKSIGTRAFDGCSGFTGTLTLSNQLTIISDYAFYNCLFKGSLIIPSTVTTIGASAFRQGSSYAGFAGELVIPNSVTSIGTVAFSNQSNITSVVLSNQLTIIPQSAFRGTGLQGVLVIPDTVQQIGSSAFAETKVETVYLSKRIDSGNTSFIQATSFNDCNKLTAIVCNKEDYVYVQGMLNNATKTKVGYPITIHFNDGNNGEYATLERLYNQSYQMQKDSSGRWNTNTSYTFPKVINNEKMRWALSVSFYQTVKETDIVTQATLYAITPLEDPLITFSNGIDKVYDGKDSTMEVSASHPLAKNIKDARVGDVVFYYTWTWSTIGSSPAVLQGFDKNQYGIRDVREPRFVIGCDVEVMACLINSANKAVPFYTVNHTFPVSLKQQESTVHPIYPKEQILVTDGLPTITLSPNDTNGTIDFDAGQTLMTGKHIYSWTFTPIQNDVGNSNYTVVKGTVELDAVDKFMYTLTVNNSINGNIKIEDLIIERGKDASIKVLPDSGYKIEYLYIDGKDVTKDIKNNMYTLKNVQDNHTIYATFIALPLADVENIITGIPDITSDTVTEEQRIEVLETMEYFLTLDRDIQDKIAPETKNVLYQTMAKLPQIQIADTQSSGSVLENELLLQTLTKQEIEALLKDKDATLMIAVTIGEVTPTTEQQQQIDATLQGASVCQTLDIDIQKKLTSKGNTQSIAITDLSIPMQFSFEIPSSMPAIEQGYERSMFIIRVHEQGDTIETTILEDEDVNDTKITISTDRFSCYAIAYYDSFVEQPEIIVPPSDVVKTDASINPNIIGINQEQKAVNIISTNDATDDTAYIKVTMLISLLGIMICVIKKRKYQ